MSEQHKIEERRARVLIVDDERKNRDLLGVILAPEGYELLMAASGEEALDMVRETPPDVVLLDIMMPGLDGYQVVARIKANPRSHHVAVIMLTALNDQNSRTHGLGAGADDFITKPVNRADVCERVKKLLTPTDEGTR